MFGKGGVTFISASLLSRSALAAGGLEQITNGQAALFAASVISLGGVMWMGGKLFTRSGRAILRPPVPEPNIETIVPFIRIEPDGKTVVNERPQYSVDGRKAVGKHEVRFVVIECDGLNYASTSADDLESFRKSRIVWQGRLAETKIAATVIYDRKLMEIRMAGTNENEWLRRVNDRWAENFKNAYANRSFIILVDEGTGDLNAATEATLAVLKVAKPRMLKHFEAEYTDVDIDGNIIKAADSELWRFIYGLVNSDLPVRAILSSEDLARSLKGAEFEFDDEFGSLSITDGVRRRLQKFIVLDKIEKERIQTDDRLIRRLMTLGHELSVYLVLRPRGGGWSNRKLKERKANREITDDGMNDAMRSDFIDLSQNFTEGEEGITETEVIICVQGETVDEVNRAADAVLDVWTQDENFRAGVACFTVMNEWERKFPGGGVPIRNMNFGRNSVADWTPFEGTPRGLSSCWWGPHPLRLVKTLNGAALALGVHAHSRDEALGNFALIGKPGSGKTVAAAFMITGALSHFPDIRVICFDNLNGLAVPTRAFGGVVVQPHMSRFAPLQIDDTPENRGFLVKLLLEMSGCEGRDAEESIEQGLDLIMPMPIQDRTLGKFIKGGVYGNSDVARGLSAWVGGGAHSGWMDGDLDSLDLDRARWITFDMTELLSDAKVCSVFMTYVMHRIQAELWTGAARSHMIFIDEAPTMFDMSDLLMETGKFLARNIRKKKGVVGFAFQDVEGMGEAGSVIVRSCATLAFWRDPSMNKAIYQEEFNLSPSDINFIADQDDATRHLSHAALFIHKTEFGQTSTPVNLSLNSLGDYLSLFKSGEDAAHLAEDCINEYGETLWVQPYIDGIKSTL